ncbi:hypothetical protein FQR65_LT11018 [Abscondita terminalis]|nr:hypothetical protein FQR65_LT11018 [Abscondita terminalis]
MIVLFVILILLVIILINKHYNDIVLAKKLKNIPGPKPLPLIYNTLDLKPPVSLLNTFGKWFDEFGDTFQSQIISYSKTVTSRDPDFVQFILNSPKLLEKGSNYRILRRWIGEGLLTSGHAKWRHHRRLISPSFNFKMIDHFVKTFNSYGKYLVSALEKEIERDNVDVVSVIKQHTLTAICLSAMGTEVTADNNFFDSVDCLFTVFMNRITSPIKAMDWTFRLTSDYNVEQQSLSIIYKYIDIVLRSRKKEIEKSPSLLDLKIDDLGIKQQTSFLDILLRQQTTAHKGFSDEEISVEIITFMVAGYETTATAISFALYNLAHHPDVQEKVVDELQGIFGNDKTRQPSNEDFANMKYLDMVLKESQRLYPSIPLISRSAQEDFTYGNTTFPKGIDVIVPIYFIHRHPQLYKDPDRFDPERFTPDNVNSRHPYSFIPFSGGLRNCIGNRYAALKVKSVMSNILRNFEVLPLSKDTALKLHSTITLTPINGFNFTLRKRNF